MNETLERFGYPEAAVATVGSWIVLIRPRQVTAGCLVLCSTSDATDVADLSPSHAAELPRVVAECQSVLQDIVAPQRVNLLCLMMKDPHVHFHLIPRYEGEREIAGIALRDTAWPGPPDLSSARELSPAEIDVIARLLRTSWDSHG